MMKERMTRKDYFEAIAELMGEEHEEYRLFLEKEIEKLSKKKSRESKKTQENAELALELLDLVEDGKVYSTKELAELLNVSTQKMTALIKNHLADDFEKSTDKRRVFYQKKSI